ncbi:uncharacterized protein LOC120633487 [Pararge aegeria]|uniref:Jg5957 protein n=2 Tax=Pararge aegeria TaxID=116150 RepID=A0A8S4RI90_9NEOP|nr:uncharacterized protein LOC120633487 [Pararge aegeria]CAH2235389.1 jg5957 [Pararge aegeria aegeria]
MARQSLEVDDDNEDTTSVTAELKSAIKQDFMKQLLNGQDKNLKIEDEALNMVVEVAKCLVKDTCLRASNQALLEGCNEVNAEHVKKCFPKLKLDFP